MLFPIYIAPKHAGVKIISNIIDIEKIPTEFNNLPRDMLYI